MIRNSKILRQFATLIGLGSLAFVAIKNLPAALMVPDSVMHIEINGVDYGAFTEIQGLNQFGKDGVPANQLYSTVRLKRDFVTDPSLYLWAKKRRSKKNELLDIHLVTRNSSGLMIKRQVLESCQPLSWSVEATNPSLGGFNETIDLAVQKVSVF